MKIQLPAKQILGSLSAFIAFGLSIHANAAEANQTIHQISTTGHDRFYAVAFDQSGNYYAAGSVSDGTDAATDSKTVIAKFLADGTLDASFGKDGYAIHNLAVGGNGEVARSLVVDANGRVHVGGVKEVAGADARDRDGYVIRLAADGSIDPTYGSEGVATVDFSAGAANGDSYTADNLTGMALDSEGRLVLQGAQKRVDGFDTDFVVSRLTAEGALDTTFATEGKFVLDNKNLPASSKTPVIMPDGSIVATGYNRDGVNVPFMFKLSADGVLDTSYGINGIFSEKVLPALTEVYGGVLHGDSIVTVGYGRADDSESIDFLSLRVDASGKLDTSYGTNGYVRVDADGFNDNGRNLAALPDGRVALVGGGRYSSVNVDGMIAILNEDGSVDKTFTDTGSQLFDFGGENDFLWGAAVSPAGDKLVTVGIKGVTATGGNDDAALVVVPLK